MGTTTAWIWGPQDCALSSLKPFGANWSPRVIIFKLISETAVNLYYVILTKLDFPEFSSLHSSVNVVHKWHFVYDLESRSETGVVSFFHEAGWCRGPRSGGTSLTVTLICWLSMLASGNSWVHSSSCFCYSCSTCTFSSRMECQLLLWTVCFIKVRGLGAVRDWLGSGPSCGC